jgi:hypothetical protein
MTTNKKRPNEVEITEDFSFQKSAGWGTTAQSTSFNEIFERLSAQERKSRIVNDN